MAITIQDYHKLQIATGGDDGSVVSGGLDTRIAGTFYIEYTKGDEADLKITFDTFFRYLEEWFPVFIDSDDTSMTPLSKSLDASGNYKIDVPVMACENKIRIDAQFENIPSNGTAGTAVITIVPRVLTI